MFTTVAENKAENVHQSHGSGKGLFFQPIAPIHTLSNSFFKPVVRPVVQRSTAKMIQRVSGDENPRYEDAEQKEEEVKIQAKRGGDMVIQRLSARDSSGGQDLIRSNVAPWRGTEPTGDEYNVYTDGGSAVPAWVAIRYQDESHRYWCHGHSLGTYGRWLYSVYSGAPLQTTIADEYNSVPEANVQSGDIAVWVPSFGHSCKIESVVRNGSAIDPNATTVSTKNGPNPLTTTSLASVIASYVRLNSSVSYYRHR